MAALGPGEIFVGREKELKRLCQLFDDVQEGVGAVALVAGEPGIGKSFLLQRLRAYAASHESIEMVGRCSEDEGAPPYWPWLQALRSYVEDCPADVLREQLGSGGSIIAEAVPDVRYRLPDLPKHENNRNPERARFRLFDALAQFLRRVAMRSPILLVLEDLHWADDPSLRFLAFLSQHLDRTQLLLTGSYRDVEVRRPHPLYRVLGELAREQHYARIELGGWVEADTARYIGLIGGSGFPKSLVTEVHRRTNGTPLFVAEVVKLLAFEAVRDLQEAPAEIFKRIPERIRETIGRRLDRLSRECNEVLALAAVVGRRFSASLLQQLAWPEGRRLLDALDEATTARVIDPATDRPGHFWFHHALIQQTLLEEIAVTERARRHAEVGLCLEKLYGVGADSNAAEIAGHLVLAGELADREKLVHYARVAAERALSVYAYEEAKAHFEDVLTALGEESVTVDAAHTWYGLGKAAVDPGRDFELHEHALGRAFDICEILHESELAVEIALALNHHSRVVRVKRRALEMVDANSASRVVLLTQLALQLDFNGAGSREIGTLFSEATSLAEQLGDPGLIAEVLLARAHALDNRGEWPQALEIAEPAVALVDRLGDDRVSADAHIRIGRLYIETENPHRAIDAGRRAVMLADRSGDRSMLLDALLQQVDNLCEFGSFVEARELSDRLLKLVPDFFVAIGQRMALELLAGDLEAGEHHLERFRVIAGTDDHLISRGVPSGTAADIYALGAFLIGRDELLDLAEDAVRLTLNDRTAGPKVRWFALRGLARAVTVRNDPETGARCYAALRNEYRNRYGSEYLLGMAAAVAGREADARRHYTRAWELCEAGGKVLTLVDTGFHFVRLLSRSDNAVDLRLASEIVGVVYEEAHRCGMKLWLEKIELLKSELLSGRAVTARPAGLSDREVEVLACVAHGLTDKQIGDRLFISARTVGNHLTNIRQKTDCHNRAEIVRFAMENNLVGSRTKIG